MGKTVHDADFSVFTPLARKTKETNGITSNPKLSALQNKLPKLTELKDILLEWEKVVTHHILAED